MLNIQRGVAQVQIQGMRVNAFWEARCAALLLLVMAGCGVPDENEVINSSQHLERSEQTMLTENLATERRPIAY
jgi:hypothetical protein